VSEVAERVVTPRGNVIVTPYPWLAGRDGCHAMARQTRRGRGCTVRYVPGGRVGRRVRVYEAKGASHTPRGESVGPGDCPR